MEPAIDFNTINARHNIEKFMQGDQPDHPRPADDNYASFDYCFNYFQTFRERGRICEICHPDNIQQSCFQIAFYLASWGMLRGSSFLLGKSARFYGGLLKAIVDVNPKVWEIDVDAYTDQNRSLLLETATKVRKSLSTTKWASDTLVTKIMLGVYGNVPAFDTYFCKGLGVGTLNSKNLKRVAEFYDCHRDVIDEYADSIHTREFVTGEDTDRHYSKAKVVDMAGFMAGYDKMAV